MSIWTIVVAAGRGDRFGTDKQSADVCGRSVLEHSVSAAGGSDGIVIVVSVISARGLWGSVGRRQLGLHFVRNVSHFTGQNLWFYAVGVIPLAQVFALEFTSPLWVLAMSPIFLAERITAPRALAAFVGFLGILVVV